MGHKIEIPYAKLEDMGDYHVVVRDGEAVGQSTVATITQLALRPRFLFSPQDVSVLNGTDIQLFAKADGLPPIDLRWFKNGTEIQSGHLLTLPNSSAADSAIYHVEATDSIGTTRSHPFQIQVSASGFGDFKYRSPGLPAGLTGMKFINGRHMGFGQEGLLLLSPNGVTWDNPTFPDGFDELRDIAYEPSLGLYVLVGTNIFDQARSAVSLDGRNWSPNPSPLPDFSVMDKVVAGNGVFVGYSTWLSNKVYVSTNGVDWVAHAYTAAGSGTSKQLENIEFFAGEFIGGGRGVIYRSTNGINWTEHPTPNNGALRVLGNQLVTFTGSPVSLSTSPDGTNWSSPVPCVNPPSNLSNISSNGSSLYFVQGTTVARSADGVAWDSITYDFDATSMSSSTVSLSTMSGPEGNLVASGPVSVLNGPSHRQLARVNTQALLTVPPITHIFDNTIYQLDKTTNQVVYSNDLRTWRRHTIVDAFDGESLFRCQGKYWALRIGILGTTSTLLSGHSPLALTPHTAGTHLATIKYLQSWNNQLYGCNDDQVFRLDANSVWQPVYTMPKPNGSLEKIRGIIATDRGVMIWSTNGPIYASTNGLSWARVMAGITPVAADIYHPTSSNRYFGPSLCEFNSKVYLYISGTNRMYVAGTGFTFVEQQNLNPFSRLTSVPQGLLGIEGTIGWFSPDGSTWQQFALPHETDFLYGYKGTLVAYSSRGIYQAGIPTSSAPIATVRNLGELQSVASGSILSIDYSILDPEDRFDRVEIYLNGLLVAQSTDPEGRSSISFSGAGRQIIEMRSYDQDGQITVDFWQINGTSNLPDKVVETATALPSSFSASVWDGRLQIGIEQELFARFPEAWLGRSVPFTTPGKNFISSPDITLAVGEYANVLATTDGITWRGLDYNTRSMKYQDGWFLADNFKAVGASSYSSLAVSRDGVSWRTALTGSLAAAAGNGIIVGLGGTGFQPSTIKVSEDGGTWTSLPGNDMKFLLFDSGFFCGIGNRTYKRSVDGKTWTDLSPSLGATETIEYLDVAGGFHYLLTRESNQYYLWSSRDQGTTWEKQTGAPAIPRQVYYGNGLWFCVASDALYSSTDGSRWVVSISASEITGGSIPAPRSRGVKFHAHEAGVSLLLNNGIWTTQDGLEWTLDEAPRAGGSLESLAQPLVPDASTRQTIMQGRVLISKNGVTWKQCPLTVSAGKTPRFSAIHNGELLVYASASNAAAELWKSSDGINFTLVNLTAAIAFQSLKHDGTRFFATGTIAGVFSHFRSTDGVNWITTSPPGGGSIFLFNQTFIVLAARIAGNPGRQDIHHSPDGITWQTKTLVNGNIDSLSFGNGVFLATQSNTLWTGASIDSLALLSSTVSPFQGHAAFAHGTFFLMTPQGIWRSALGQSWEPLYSALTGSLEVTGDTAYIRATSNLRPVLPPDLQVTAVASAPANLAVGDEFPATVTFRNIGLAPIPQGTNLRFRGILSRDGKLGNGDDISAGNAEVILNAAVPTGGTADLDLDFQIPALEAGGQFTLIVVADPELPEMTRANNIGITDSVAVVVDEFVLNTVRNGDGEVNQSYSALRYANGTLVTLSATAGKGSGFNGWSGSRVSPLSQITLMMNQNQTLTANFVASATLQLSIQGSGEVDGWADPGTYPAGQTATLTARPNPGWTFAGWVGGSSSTNPLLSVVMTENTSITAVFRQSLSAWKSMHFLSWELNTPSISGDLIDADQDGVPNWQEYLHGSDPMEKKSKGILQSGLDGGFIQMIYTRNTGASLPYDLSCEGSRNFTDWAAPDFEERILSTENGIETIEARMPATGAGNDRGFLRMKYGQP
jgi:Divergent InlB B-repeat domain/Immunoglobulin I-set domain